jgi:hypothetical protein
MSPECSVGTIPAGPFNPLAAEYQQILAIGVSELAADFDFRNAAKTRARDPWKRPNAFDRFTAGIRLR